MQNISIRVSDYYGSGKYYAFMPRPVFDALEAAFLKGSEFAQVSQWYFE